MRILIAFFVIVLLIVSDNLTAQVQSVWTKRFNGPANSADNAKFITVDQDGFVYVGGTVTRILGYPDFAVLKRDRNGDTVWVRYYDSPVNQGGELNGLVVDKFGNVIITGTSVGANYSDFATIKYDANGSRLWEKRFDGGDIDAALALAVDESGNVFVTGTRWEIYESYNYMTIKYSPNGDSLWARFWLGPDGSADMSAAIALDKVGNVYISGTHDWYYGTVNYLTIKYSGSGASMWSMQYNGPANSHDYARLIAVDNDGNTYVTGDSYNASNSLDIATIKYNEYGDTLWVRRYNGPANGDDNVKALVVDSLGNVYLAGTSSESATGADYLTIKYNSAGVQQWAKTYAGYSTYGDVANALAIDKAGNVYVTGISSSSSTNRDFATIKYDKDGNQQWVIRYDGTMNAEDFANGICVDTSGYVYVTGASQGVGSGLDFTTIKYQQTGVGVADDCPAIPTNFAICQNYPNPFNPTTVIRFQLPAVSDVRLVVYDVLGREVASLVDGVKRAGSFNAEFDGSNLASGVYIYRLTALPSGSQGGLFVQTRTMLLMK